MDQDLRIVNNRHRGETFLRIHERVDESPHHREAEETNDDVVLGHVRLLGLLSRPSKHSCRQELVDLSHRWLTRLPSLAFSAFILTKIS